jgi:hypothetical protein
VQAVFPLTGMVTLGWVLVTIGFSIEIINKEKPAAGSFRYPWWMVILVTPYMLVMAVVQAAIDNNRLVMNIIGAIVSSIVLAATEFLWYTILSLILASICRQLFSVLCF